MELVLNYAKKLREFDGSLEDFLIENEFTFEEFVLFMEQGSRNWTKVEDDIYTTTQNTYKIIHYDEITSSHVNYGTYKTLKSAQLAKILFEKASWEYNSITEVKALVSGYKKCQEAYIYNRGTGYAICKWINGKYSYFGWYKSLDEAINQRDNLINNNWVKI